jgi:hypothetical protein
VRRFHRRRIRALGYDGGADAQGLEGQEPRYGDEQPRQPGIQKIVEDELRRLGGLLRRQRPGGQPVGQVARMDEEADPQLRAEQLLTGGAAGDDQEPGQWVAGHPGIAQLAAFDDEGHRHTQHDAPSI